MFIATKLNLSDAEFVIYFVAQEGEVKKEMWDNGQRV